MKQLAALISLAVAVAVVIAIVHAASAPQTITTTCDPTYTTCTTSGF